MSATLWSVTVNTAAPNAMIPLYDAALDDLQDRLDRHAGIVTHSQPNAARTEYGATIDVNADDAAIAIRKAIRVITTAAAKAGLPALPIVRASALTATEQDRELARPAGHLGLVELAELLGTSRQRATQIALRPGFPAPVARLRSGPVWQLAPVTEWVETWARKPGRPARAS